MKPFYPSKPFYLSNATCAATPRGDVARRDRGGEAAAARRGDGDHAGDAPRDGCRFLEVDRVLPRNPSPTPDTRQDGDAVEQTHPLRELIRLGGLTRGAEVEAARGCQGGGADHASVGLYKLNPVYP